MKQYKVLLTKIVSTHTNLRTDSVEGVAIELPEKGKHFSVVGQSLTPGVTHRVVTTTEIQSVEAMGDEYMFNTLNSTYKVKVLGEIDTGVV